MFALGLLKYGSIFCIKIMVSQNFLKLQLQFKILHSQTVNFIQSFLHKFVFIVFLAVCSFG